MWSDRIALGGALALAAVPAAAHYAHAPFHDRPRAVAELALAVLDGEAAVAVPQDDVPLAAAVAALLLVSELGLAEAFEEAVEGGEEDGDDDGDGGAEAGEDDGYAAAYGLLQAVRPWLAAVPQDAETADLVARLDALMPTPERPARLDADPEAAEVVAQALVGRLERAADADLYLGRDLFRALGTVSALAAEACAQPPGDARQAGLGIAAFYFEDALEAPLSVMAAQPAEAIEDALEALLGAPADAEALCAGLAADFAAASETLFPGRRP